MESMRRGEVNVSHHQNKVVTNNSIVTESTKHNKLVGSADSTPISATSSLNNKLNASSHKQHQYQNNTKHNVNRKVASSKNFGTTKLNSSHPSGAASVSLKGCGFPKLAGKSAFVNAASKEGQLTSATTYPSSYISSESKDTNFEYEDEWDIGGIPELLDDLDADIEKSSSAAQNLSKASNSGGGRSDIEASTTSLKISSKSSTSNKINAVITENLLDKQISSSATIGKFTSSTLARSLTAAQLSSFPANSKEKLETSVKCSRTVSIPSNTCISTSKCTVGLLGKSTNKSSAITNIGSHYQKSGGNKNYQIQQLSFEEYSADGGHITKVASTATKSSSSAASSLSSLSSSSSVSALAASLASNSESVQKSNTLTVSTFAGFSKGGNLVSSFTNSLLPSSSSVSPSNLSTTLGNDSLSNLSNHSASGMSSQSSGTNSNNSSAGGGAGGGGQGGSQSIGGSGGGGKSNAKMSIDHQATLDKGLKMKIKRTKPGTKTSEAKHEIVKATEQQQQQQQQNGSINVNNPSNLDENSGLNTTSSHSSSSSGGTSGSGGSNQNSGSSSGSGSSVTNISSSNKKHLSNISSSNNSSQGNSHNSMNSNSPASGSGPSGTGSSGQVTPQSNKRGSSGHRREKAKEKTTHSNRLTADKSASATSDKEVLAGTGISDKGITCHCTIDATNGNGASTCSNHACVRRSESGNNTSINVLTQRMINTAGNSNATSGSVPPGVFTPSVGSPAGVVTAAAATAASLLAASSAGTTTTPQAIGNSNATNAPGPVGKDSTNCSNIKISSHIAAQLAAVAASTTFSNNVSNSATNTLSGSNESKTNTSIVPVAQAKLMAPGMISATVHHTISVPANSSSTTTTASTSTCSSASHNNLVTGDGIKSPPAKRAKHGESSNASSVSAKDMVDICIGTSVGTITEPDCLGPCEPGTSVTLEGIVWHETEGGVLVVNVTWRGKTYVGTLLDCTRHDWAPPRFCDSPTEELDSRTPKGRGKRGRSAALTPDLSNFTETRSSIYFSHAQVHSKLRNGTTKGGRGATRTAITATSTANTTTITSSSSSGNGGGATPSTSPTAFLPPRSEKRKSKDESPSPINGDSESTTNVANASGIPISASGGGLAAQPQSLVNPVTGLNVQISTKKCKTASPCAISPVLLECPEQDCSKKYKHANGLRYHQSHAHGSACSMDEDSLQLPEEPPTPTSSPVPSAQSVRAVTPNAAEGSTLPAGAVSIISPETPPISTSTIPAPTSESTSQPTATVLPPSSQSTTQTSNLDAVLDSDAVTGAVAASVAASSISSSVLIPSAPVSTVSSSSSANATIGSVLTAPAAQSLLPQSHPVAGGSITAGISGQVLSQQQQQQQQQQQSLGMSSASNPILPVLLSEQAQTSALPQQSGPKPGVLRFGPQSDTSNSGPPPTILALQQQASQGISPQVSAIAGQSPQRTATQLTTNPESLQQPHQPSISTYTSSTASAGQNLQGISLSTKNSPGFTAVKQKKCRKSPGPVEFDGIVTRDNVQSPAYSDISDDSTPVGDQDILDKSQPKHIDLPNKKPSDLGNVGIGTGSQAIPPLGGYGMYQFYQQQQYMVPPPSSDQQPSQTPKQGLLPSNLVQPSLTLPTSQPQQQGSIQPTHLMQQQQQQQSHQQQQRQQSPLLTDYNNKSKDPPLDLMTKPSQQQQLHGHQSQMHVQEGVGSHKDNASGQPSQQQSGNLSNVGPPNNGLPPGMGPMQTLGPSGVGPGSLQTPSPAKPLSHFYPFNYMAPGYPYNVEPNYGPVSIVASEDAAKMGNHGGLLSSQPQNTGPPHSNPGTIKDERIKESPSPHECSKQMPQQQQLVSTKLIKSEPMTKQEIKQEHNPGPQPQQQQQQQQQPPQQQQQPQQPHALHPKDLQGLGTYPNIYQRHPMTLAAQQHLSREEELRRYYILSDEQRRQSAVAALRAVQAQNPNSGPPGPLQTQMLAQQHKEDSGSSSQHQQQMSIAQQQQQQQQQHQQQQHQQSQKSKSQNCPSANANAGSGKATNLTKESSKQKQEEEVKIKQEGQKPTMETQGPPPPPTSQYFLHPSYIAPAPFSFDPNHPMYRNVLMSAAGPYNAAPYHLPIPRYHAPEDLSRNTGTKALDALHHAASQYYTTHKIHELSERALKSPTSGSSSGPGGPVKVSVSSPNVGIQQQQQQQQQQQNVNNSGVSGPGNGPNVAQNVPNSGNHLPTTNQSSSGSGIPLNLQPPPTGMSGGPTNKSDVLNQKVLSGPGGPSGNLAGGPLNIESHKQQGGPNGPNSGGTIGSATTGGNNTTADSRSPPPQRHVHTHHHTHVGLGYPMYTAPYGAAVLASQQAAAVAVINPFPPGPTK